MLGIPLPFHRNFEEVNLRFYVRSVEKRGVVFVQELVPKRAVAFLANALYNEHYRVAFEQFIAEHYWGYAAQSNGDTMEYAVEHPPWLVWPASDYHLDIDFRALYGSEFVGTLSQTCPRRTRADSEGAERAVIWCGSRATDHLGDGNGAFRSSYCMYGDMAQSVTRVNPLDTVFTAEGHHGPPGRRAKAT